VLGLSGEFLARCFLGLGTPPLWQKEATIEYMLKPNQDVYRFGNEIIVNRFGMRSNDFSNKKKSNEFRVMIYGDSVVYGGSQLDQTLISTSILQEKLQKNSQKNQNIIVGNISAKSWGPTNLLSYVKKYGFFDADIIFLVINSHDYTDVPTFEPLNDSTHPTITPISALYELLTIYVPRYLPNFKSKIKHGSDNKINEGIALNDLNTFLELAKKNSKKVIVFQHWEKSEIKSGANVGFYKIKEVSESLGIVTISLGDAYSELLKKGINPYIDNIHPNRQGQKVMADIFYQYIDFK
jgi:hypothetical protein